MGCVYVLESARGRTYVGATLNLARRLRQHVGGTGARRTAGDATWRVACTVRGFRTWSETLKFEYALRRVGRYKVRRWDLEGRRRALVLLQSMERWSSTSPLASEVPLVVEWTVTTAVPRSIDDGACTSDTSTGSGDACSTTPGSARTRSTPGARSRNTPEAPPAAEPCTQEGPGRAGKEERSKKEEARKKAEWNTKEGRSRS